MKNLLEKTNRFFTKMKKDRVSECAAECAYFTILAFIPFIIFLITLIQYFRLDEGLINFVVKELFPTSMQDLINNIIIEAHSKSSGTISIAIVITLWSAGKGFFALCKGLRIIYKVEDDKPTLLKRVEGSVYTLIFIFSIIVLLVVGVFGNSIYHFVNEKFEVAGIIISKILKVRTFLFMIGLFVLFLFIYSFIPRHKRKMSTQIVGAIFTSIAWYIISLIFSMYVDIFKGFSNTYGSLATIILIMMWVYFCMYIILIGAEINCIVQEYKHKMLSSKNKF